MSYGLTYKKYLSDDKPEHRERILKELLKLSTFKAEHSEWRGICKLLQEAMLDCDWFSSYYFVAFFSNYYDHFEVAYNDELIYAPRWVGANGDYRRRWCLELHNKLKTDPKAWKKPAKALKQLSKE